MKKFTVTKNHIKLLQSFYIGWNDCEFGAPSIDPKRPFGNSNVYRDMADILGFELADMDEEPEKYDKQINSLQKGYQELQTCLQILCKNLSIEIGEYECDDYKTNWRKVKNV